MLIGELLLLPGFVVFHYDLSVEDAVVLSVYLLSAIVCMTLSSVFHLFSNSDEETYERVSKADQTGILVLMLGSNFPMVYYGFYTSPPLQIFYAVGSLFIVLLARSRIVRVDSRSSRENVPRKICDSWHQVTDLNILVVR
eukprot:747684-Hanusia_phi.AAC.4